MQWFTVIGLWHGDAPVCTGIIAGRHDVGGGDTSDINDQGVWATSAYASDMAEAERLAIAEMSDDEQTCPRCGETGYDNPTTCPACMNAV
ncbi:hypothetical protein ANMWB30_09430 [Arthrobacter sp. MWB30]|nr:hypothetical protein ANMWB30_09430 [Arthrobacter sp. MWB30]